MDKIKCPPPGIYQNVPEPEYRAWDAVNASNLSLSQEKDGSMLTLKAAMDGMIKFSSDAMAFGTAFHCKALEPDRFKSEYSVAGKCIATIQKTGMPCGCDGKYTQDGVWYCGKHKPEGSEPAKNVIAEDENETIKGMYHRLLSHPKVGDLRELGGSEVSIVWVDKPSGVTCKARIDKLTPNYSLIIDLKAILSAIREDAMHDVKKYNWHMRAPFYCDGIKALTGVSPKYIFVMIEKKFPYEIGVYDITDDDDMSKRTIHIGREIYKSLLQRWAYAVKMNKYPGINNDEITGISLSEWAIKKEEATHGGE